MRVRGSGLGHRVESSLKVLRHYSMRDDTAAIAIERCNMVGILYALAVVPVGSSAAGKIKLIKT